LRWLKSNSPDKISQAAVWFSVQPRDDRRQIEVQQAILDQLQSGRSPQAGDLLGALTVWGSADATTVIINVAKHQPNQSERVVHLLGKYDDPRTTAGLIVMLKQGEEQRKQATNGLIGKREAGKAALLPLLNDSDVATRTAVRKALEEIRLLHDEILPQALRDLASDSAEKRALSLEWLGTASLSPEKRPEATKAIALRLKDDDRTVRAAALKALMADKSKDSSDALLPYVSDRQGPWNEVLSALMERGDQRVAEPLGKLVKEPLTMGQALQAIRTTSGEGEEVVLQCIKTTDDAQLVQHILFALAESGTQKSVETIKKLLLRAQQTKNAGLQIATQHALKRINERGK
jgi:HEAT repeat protein